MTTAKEHKMGLDFTRKQLESLTGKSYARLKADLKRIYNLDLQNLAICMAKTEKSFSDNPASIGRPQDFTFNIREIEIAAGAGLEKIDLMNL